MVEIVITHNDTALVTASRSVVRNHYDIIINKK